MAVSSLSLFVGPWLDAYANAPAHSRQDIEEHIWAEYGQDLFVLVLDMSGFSLLTQRHGIIYYLAMVRRMHRIVEPMIRKHQGFLVKFEADNAFAVFPDAASTVASALAIREALAADPHPETIRVSMGIDGGRVLMVDQADVFGHAVNRASKLGEDIAHADEILLTTEVYAQLDAQHRPAGRPTRVTVAGIEIEVISL
ncbi:MAG TPA: adenylate/guanylate cyclase domain-containing protein [Rhodocyclaceae bacterium]|nr:adenylate/guanylate cyclase domain-containing protein [Rhodocyclaceae bacterium]